MNHSTEEFLKVTTLASFQGVSSSLDDNFKVWSHSREWHVLFVKTDRFSNFGGWLPNFELFYHGGGAGEEEEKRFVLGSKVDDSFRRQYLKDCFISVSDGGHVAVRAQTKTHLFWIGSDNKLTYDLKSWMLETPGSGLAIFSNQMSPDDQKYSFPQSNSFPFRIAFNLQRNGSVHVYSKNNGLVTVNDDDDDDDDDVEDDDGNQKYNGQLTLDIILYGEDDSFGSSLGFSGDGSLLAIAAPLEDSPSVQAAGAIYIYYDQIGSDDWQLVFKQVYGNVPQERLGLYGVYLPLPSTDGPPTVVARSGDGQFSHFSILVSLLFWRATRAMIFKF